MSDEVQSEFLGFYKPEHSQEQPPIRVGVIRVRRDGGFAYPTFCVSDEALLRSGYDVISKMVLEVTAAYIRIARILEDIKNDPVYTDTGDGGVIVSAGAER